MAVEPATSWSPVAYVANWATVAGPDFIDLNIVVVKLNKNLTARNFLFVLRFYSSSNQIGPCQAQSDYLTTLLLGRLSPLTC